MDDELARSMVRAAPDALWLLAPDGSTIWGNERLEALIGRTVAELVALGRSSALAVSSEADLDAHRAHVEEMRAHHPGRQNDEVIAQRPDGSQVWLMASWSPVHGDDGELIGYLHRLTEYTERRELLDRLSESEAQLASAQAIAHLGSWLYDVATDTTAWSDELYRIYDLDPDRFEPTFAGYLGRSHPDDRDQVRRTIEDTMREGRTYAYESRILTPSGEVRWLSSNGVVVRDEHGAPVRLYGTCQDVSALHRVDAQAQAARLRLRLFSRIAEAANRSDSLDAALGRAGEALAEVDEWRTLAIWARPDADEPPIQLYDGSASGDAVPGDATVAAIEAWSTGRLSTCPSPREGCSEVWMPVTLDGRVVRLIRLEGQVPEVDEGTHALLEQVSGTLGRVAEREHAAIELAAARDAAMAASAHKSTFLATMSHEIRTPMNGVIGLTDLLLASGLDAQQRRLADGLRGAGLTLLALINDILDLSKIESGAVELDQAPFAVAEVLDQTAAIISPPAQEKRLELVMSCHPDVPRTLVGDRVRLGQVLTNLASNAVKFTERGEVVVELSVDPSDDPARVLLRGEVTDTGIGIGADAAGLFEAFSQADRSTTRTHGGTGLGLAISRRLVQDMGGSIGADERAGGGSRFWFTVPVDRAADEAPAHEPGLDGRRALVVDDHRRAASTLARQLSAWGLDVRTVPGADEALAALDAAAGTDAPFDLALVDLHMPGVDGLTLGAQVSARGGLSGLPMILLSDDPSTRPDDATAVGFGAIVAKPLRLSELRDAVLEALLDTGELQVATVRRARPESRGLHVLVVEDNPVNQLVARGLLEALGCTSDVAANGLEAVDALRPGHRFDLVLMDCRMPRMDGYEATALVRAQESGSRVPIVAMTASALTGERDRCLAAGMDDFLTKPVDALSLRRMVHLWSASDRSAIDLHPDDTDTDTDDHGPGEPPTPVPPRPEDRPVLDPERVEMLRELVRDGVDFFERTRASYLARVSTTMAALREAREADDLGEVGALAHQLKGSALNLGLPRTGAAAGEVEAAATSGPAEVDAAIAALVDAVAEGVDALGEVGAGRSGA